MSDMNELLEEDLIDELELAFNQKLFVAKEKYPYRVERILQALAQLKQIVEQQFATPIVNCPRCGSSFKWQDYIDEGAKPQLRLRKLLSQARPQQGKPSEWDGQKRSKSAEARWLEIPYSAYKIAYDRGYDEAQPKKVKVTREWVKKRAIAHGYYGMISVDTALEMLSELGHEVEDE